MAKMKKITAAIKTIKRCNCVSAFQDARYGRKMRVHNSLGAGRGNSESGSRCTVCGKG